MKKRVLAFTLMIVAIITKAAVVTVSGDITTNTTWTSNNIYLLSGFVYVTNNASLTIQPGTIVQGEKLSKGSLIITRGAKIIADGTVSQPIVFTSNQAPGFRSAGDWGGLILCGNAPVNDPAGERLIEGGVDAIKGLYGGVVSDDSSGVVRYVRIEFAGIAFALNNEINGLTCGGVGSKTVIDYVQVSFSGDDSFEWFGGTVNAKHLIALRGVDDDFDTDYGFSGKLQFIVGLRDSSVADISGSNGFESDNDAGGTTNLPYTHPIFSNASVFGPQITSTTNININFKRALHLRRSTKTCTYNSVFAGYPVGLKIDGANTATNVTNLDLEFKNNIIAGCATPLDSTALVFGMNAWFYNPSNANTKLTNSTDLQAVNPYNYTAPNFLPAAGSPMLSGASFSSANLTNSFFEPVSYKGAFGSTDWTKCWAEFDPQYASYTGTIQYITQPSITAGGATTFCTGGSVTLTAPTSTSYLWSSLETTQSISASTTGNYSVTVKNARGCTSTSANTAVTVNTLPTATITASRPTTFCTGDSTVLTASTGSSYLWSPGNETTNSITVKNSGDYSVTVTNAASCSKTSSITSVSSSSAPTPTIALTGNNSICQGDSVLLTSTLSDSYAWSNGKTTRSIYAKTSGNYSVVTTNANICAGVGTSNIIAITVNALPVSSFTMANNENTYAFTNASTGASTYLWDFGDMSSSTATNPVKVYSQYGTYQVKLTATSTAGCSANNTQSIDYLLGVKSIAKENVASVLMYPNPTTSTVTLQFNNFETSASINLYDLSGKLLSTSNTHTDNLVTLDTQDLYSGIYYVQIASNKYNKTLKLVKE